jgi:catechol 2,3-dioxygenase-like lactoylglutathione lyase family enzyme
MPKTTTPKGIKATPVKREARDDVPQFFRLNVEVGDLDGAIAFYTDLLGVQGRKQPGHRCYFECGPVTLQVVDVSSNGRPHPAARALYFTVEHLEGPRSRASRSSRWPRLRRRADGRTRVDRHHAAAFWWGGLLLVDLVLTGFAILSSVRATSCGDLQPRRGRDRTRGKHSQSAIREANVSHNANVSHRWRPSRYSSRNRGERDGTISREDH